MFGRIITGLACLLLSLPVPLYGEIYRGATVEINPNRLAVGLNEPVSARLIIKNGGTEPFSVELGDDRISNIVITAVKPDGKEVRSQLPTHAGLARLGRIDISPGASYSQTLVLNKWADFDEEGVYQVRIEIVRPPRTIDAHLSDIASVSAQVTVGPREPLLLQKVCADAVHSLVGATSYDDALTAADVLSHTKDPIAVPFLEDAVAHTSYPIQNLLITGLESIGTPDAVRVLIKIASTNSTLLPEVRASLGRMLASISDVQLRAKAQQVVGVK